MRWGVADPMLATHIHIGMHVNFEVHDLYRSQRRTFGKPNLETKRDRGEEVAQGARSPAVAGPAVRFVTLKGEGFVILNKLGTSMHVVDEGGFYEGSYMTSALIGREELRRLFDIGAELGVVDPNL